MGFGEEVGREGWRRTVVTEAVDESEDGFWGAVGLYELSVDRFIKAIVA